MSGGFTKGTHPERVKWSTVASSIDASVRNTTLSEPWFREDRVPKLLDPVVKSIRRRVVCNGVWHVGSFGVCGREYAFLAALIDRDNSLMSRRRLQCARYRHA